MNETTAEIPVEIRVFGALRKHLDRLNLPYLIKKQIPTETSTPVAIAGELELPQNEIEAVFVNGKISDMYTVLSPGDRIAFLPYGTPGPYRVFLGIVNREDP
jgi:molybdopterin converting factor small subunit